MKTIGIMSWGTHGDLLPCFNLARQLAENSFKVHLTVANPTPMDLPEISEKNILLTKLDTLIPNALDVLKSITANDNPLKQMETMVLELQKPHDETVFAHAMELCETCDLVIGHFALYQLKLASEIKKTPLASLLFAPLTYPSKYEPIPGLPYLGPLINSTLWKTLNWFFDRTYGKRVNEFRARHRSPEKKDILNSTLSQDLCLIAASPYLLDPPKDWPPSYKVCGQIEAAEHCFANSQDLELFLREHSKPIFMGFGSMGLFHPQKDLEIFLQVAQEIAQPVIVQTPLAGDQDLKVPNEKVFLVKKAAHSKVFPHCSLVIHHGGAGTSHTAARSGCLSVVVQFGADQLMWGEKLKKAGIGGPVLSRANLTVNKLKKAMQKTLKLDSQGAFRLKAQRALFQEQKSMQYIEEIESQYLLNLPKS